MQQGDDTHILERRAAMLAERLTIQKDTIRSAIARPGERLPFTKELSKKDALEWWKRNRFNDLGKQVLANMKPEQVMELDKILADSHMQDKIDAQSGSSPVASEDSIVSMFTGHGDSNGPQTS